MSPIQYKVVILDMGGVLIPSHVNYIEDENLDKIMATLLSDEFGPIWHDLEVGNITLEAFHPLMREFFEKQHNLLYTQPIDTMRYHVTSGHPLSQVIPIWFPTIRKIRDEGIKVVVLTNNFWTDADRLHKTTPLDERHYDAIFESCKLGMRKPNADIYEYVLKDLKIKPHEAIFVDDMARNIEGASKLGITTIQCKDVTKTIEALEEVLGLVLQSSDSEEERNFEANHAISTPAN